MLIERKHERDVGGGCRSVVDRGSTFDPAGHIMFFDDPEVLHLFRVLRDDDRVLVGNPVDMPCAYVVHDHARAANGERSRAWLSSFDTVLAGRYSQWAYDSAAAALAG